MINYRELWNCSVPFNAKEVKEGNFLIFGEHPSFSEGLFWLFVVDEVFEQNNDRLAWCQLVGTNADFVIYADRFLMTLYHKMRFVSNDGWVVYEHWRVC